MLRDYQSNQITLLNQRQDNAIIVAPTGVGKGELIRHCLLEDFDCDRRSLVIVPSHSLKQNIEQRLPTAVANYIQIETYQMAVRHTKDQKFDKVYIDEAHITACNSIQTILDSNIYDRLIGFTATPERLDGKPLSPPFERIIPTYPVRWFINQGYLNDYRLYTIDDSKLRDELSGSYSDRLLVQQALLNNKATIANAIELWHEYAFGKQTFFFCTGKEHARDSCQQFSEKYPEFRFVVIDADTPNDKVDSYIQGFRDGIIKGIFNIDRLYLGVDVPNAECCFLLVFTYSLVRYLQSIGRVLRKSTNVSIIIDPYGNALEHGHPDIARIWSLTGNKKGKVSKYYHCYGCRLPLVEKDVALIDAIGFEYSCYCPKCGDFNLFAVSELLPQNNYRRSRQVKKAVNVAVSEYSRNIDAYGMTKILNNSKWTQEQKAAMVIKSKNLQKAQKAELLKQIGYSDRQIDHLL